MIGLPPDLLPFISSELEHLFAVFLRVSALVSLLPAFGERSIPARVKLAIAVAFTLVVSSAIDPSGAMSGLFPVVRLIGTEILTGLALGLSLRLFVLALQTAGSIAAQATSLSQLLGGAAEGEAASVVRGVPTSGVIPSGAKVEREIEFELSSLSQIRLALREPDFTTGERIETAVNSEFRKAVAIMRDSGTVELSIPATGARSAAHALRRIENILVEPETKARVVVDQRSGTIVMGQEVRISRVAVSQGNLTLTVEEAPIAIQPNPFARGETVVVPRTVAGIDEEEGTGLAEIPEATTLSEVVAGLNALGVSPRDMIDILKTIKAAGALHAEFIVR